MDQIRQIHLVDNQLSLNIRIETGESEIFHGIADFAYTISSLRSLGSEQSSKPQTVAIPRLQALNLNV